METFINLFRYKEKVFIFMKTWIAEKNLMKHNYQIKKTFYSEVNSENITDKDYAHAQKVWKVFQST